ncbi:triphosphate tunel metalloenzyme 3-like protein [Tanacetum coccineum]|uniref:Triphosphate tunel metalloenzyme 3-like protein n=1 Tax=Tanacetum coccineum TaxID=301880 RepID=A0ABQ5EX47_9ASTR
MEIEVKLRLQNQETHKTLKTLLNPHHTKTHNQHNHFFDTVSNHLSTHRAVLRLRLYTNPPPSKPTCILSLKSKPILQNGVSRVQEDEEEIDPDEAQRVLSDPTRLRTHLGSSRIMTRVKNEYLGGNDDVGQFVCLGGFKNLRNVYEWKDLVLEVDETSYEFGTLYEVECESVEPEKAKGLIEGFLKENGVEYEYSVMSKFAIFRSGKLP